MTVLTPEFLADKSYSAMRDRLAFQHGGGVQPGTWNMGDFYVTQRSTPNMSVDVAAGFALVAANDPGNAGLYHVQNDASVNVSQQASGAAWAVGHATLPRVDQIFLVVNDTTDGSDSSDGGTIVVVQGGPTTGANLDNRNSVGAVPTGALLLADVLVPAGATTVTTANIRDRRPSARQGWFKIMSGTLSAGAITFSGLTLWGGVEHVKVSGRVRSLRAGFASTGLRFTVNGVGTGYIVTATVDSGTATAAQTAQNWGFIGTVAAINSADLATFEMDMRYINNVDGKPKYVYTTSTSFISSGNLFANERAANAVPMTSARFNTLTITDDVGSSLDPLSHAELWVFGG